MDPWGTWEIVRVGGRSRSFKVTDFDINRRAVCALLLLNNSSYSLRYVLHRLPYRAVLIKLLLLTGGTFV